MYDFPVTRLFALGRILLEVWMINEISLIVLGVIIGLASAWAVWRITR